MTTTDTDSVHERLARLEKSIHLCDLLDALGWDAEDVEHASQAMWDLAASLADVRKPSASTVAVVADLMRQRRAARAKVAV